MSLEMLTVPMQALLGLTLVYVLVELWRTR